MMTQFFQKTLYLLFFLLVSTHLSGNEALLDAKGNLHPSLLRILDAVEMPPLNPTKNALTQINCWAQKNLLRQGERWNIQSARFEHLKPALLPYLKDLGLVEAKFPCFKRYTGAIIHGALYSRVSLRLQFLIDQWNLGVRFSHLYFLTGERPLQECEKELLQSTAKTECEMIQQIWEKSDLPPEMRSLVEVHFVNAPMKGRPNAPIRPTTNDTIKKWLRDNPPRGSYLSVTNAPYHHRQDQALRRLAPSTFHFETVGTQASDDLPLWLFLDELARMIYDIAKG